MRQPVLTIFYQFNPWNSSIGGIQTMIRSFIKFAPSKFEVRMVGICEAAEEVGKWQDLEYAGTKVKFLPVIAVDNDDVRKLVPTTVKYTAALSKYDLASDFMHFHRLEPTIAALSWQGDKTLFIYNDIQEKFSTMGGINKLLLGGFPVVYFALEKLLVQQLDRIYSDNSKVHKFYRERYPNMAERIGYLKNAVDTEIFHPPTSEESLSKRETITGQLGLSVNTKFVLFAGRLHPQKDPILLVRAFAALDKPDAHLLIVGEGELAESIRSEIDACGLRGRVTLMGALEQAKLYDLYCIASVFVLSSVYEGLPFAVLEALACGTPVVTTNCGETPNLLTAQSGVVAQKRSPEALATALSQVIQNPTVYSSEACVSVAAPYTAKAVVGDVYQYMLGLWEEKQLAIQ